MKLELQVIIIQENKRYTKSNLVHTSGYHSNFSLLFEVP